METQSAGAGLPLTDQLREARSLLLICAATVAVTAIAGWVYSGVMVAIEAATDLDILLPVTVCAELSFLAAAVVVVLNLGRVVSARAVVRPWPIVLAVVIAVPVLVIPSAGILEVLLIAGPLVLIYLAACVVCAIHDHRIERGAVAAQT